MTGADVKAVREAWGWSQQQVADATGYHAAHICAVERGRRPVMPNLADWAGSVGWPPKNGAYAPTMGGLRIYLRKRGLRLVELAGYLGTSENTVRRWLQGVTPVPLPIRAWLAAGAPRDWVWGPPDAESDRYKPDRRCPDGQTRLRPEGCPLARTPDLVKRWERAAQPRPRRARVA